MICVVCRPDVQGELLKTEFAKHGKVTAFKFFEKDHKMALIQMETIDDAVMGLVVSVIAIAIGNFPWNS